ncbi:MAG: hypothetical protein QM286_04985 [Acidobacteriota bacterium]|nr:hypothetical protein [Acidobacteriota bacterium]
MAARKIPTTVDLWIVTDPEGIAVERLQNRLGHPLPRSTRTTLPDTYRFNEAFPCGAVLPADIPADVIRRLASCGYIQRVRVPLPKEQ